MVLSAGARNVGPGAQAPGTGQKAEAQTTAQEEEEPARRAVQKEEEARGEEGGGGGSAAGHKRIPPRGGTSAYPGDGGVDAQAGAHGGEGRFRGGMVATLREEDGEEKDRWLGLAIAEDQRRMAAREDGAASSQEELCSPGTAGEREEAQEQQWAMDAAEEWEWEQHRLRSPAGTCHDSQSSGKSGNLHWGLARAARALALDEDSRQEDWLDAVVEAEERGRLRGEFVEGGAGGPSTQGTEAEPPPSRRLARPVLRCRGKNWAASELRRRCSL